MADRSPTSNRARDAEAPSLDATVELLRRRRGRNLAILLALIAFVALVYAISVVRIGAGIEASIREREELGLPIPGEEPPAPDATTQPDAETEG